MCWPAIGQGQGPADSRVWAGLLWVGWFNRLQYCGFLVFGLPSVGEAILETSAGSLEDQATAYLLMGGDVSLPSDGHSCI